MSPVRLWKQVTGQLLHVNARMTEGNWTLPNIRLWCSQVVWVSQVPTHHGENSLQEVCISDKKPPEPPC